MGFGPFLFLILLLFELSSLAQADFSGRAHLQFENYLGPQVSPIKSDQQNLTLEIESKHSFSENFQIRFEPQLKISIAEKLVDVSLDYNLRDSQIEANFSALHFQIGSFIKAWEGPDGYNPMDIATMKSYRNPFAPENLGSLGISLAGGESQVTWETQFIPWQTAPRLPGENSRWLPRKTSLPLSDGSTSVLAPENPEFQIATHQSLNEALRNNFGGRIQFHGKAWDLSLAAFVGAAQLPVSKVALKGDLIQIDPPIIQLNNPIQLQPVDYRRRTLALGIVSSAQETWIYRLAGRHDQPLGDDVVLPTWTEQFVGSMEKSLEIFQQMAVLSLGYSYGRSPQLPSGPLTIQDPFQASLLYGARLPIGDNLLLVYSGLWEHRHNAAFNRLKAERKISEHFILDFSLDQIQGPANSLFGFWTNQSRASLGLLLQF